MPEPERPHRYPPAAFTEPTPYGYLYAGFAVDPPRRLPVVRPSKARDAALARLTALARQFDGLPDVVKASVFRAVFLPPITGAPRFDIILLVRTTSPDALAGIPTIDLGADRVITAVNTRRIGATEPFPPNETADFYGSTYLFNHFVAADADDATAAWEKLTGWYLAKTGVDNSTLLRPYGDSPYAIINYVRIPAAAPRFLLSQVLRPSFTSFVRATLKRHSMTALPAFYQPVS